MISQKTLKMLKVFALLAFLLALGALVYWWLYFSPTKFDRDIWLNGENECSNLEAPRLRMADGLIGSKKLLGLTKKQIDDLLGPQTPTSYFKTEYDYVYILGPERSFIRIDHEWLVIKFDHNDIVSKAHIVTD